MGFPLGVGSLSAGGRRCGECLIRKTQELDIYTMLRYNIMSINMRGRLMVFLCTIARDLFEKQGPGPRNSQTEWDKVLHDRLSVLEDRTK